MSDTARSNAPLSEISHLFLTGVRERQTHGNRPVRTPPRPAAPPAENPVKKNVSIDLTPEELEHQSSPGLLCDSDAATQKPSRQISIVLAHHLGERGPSHVRQYARHIALRAGRVGLIELGEQSTRLVCFDASPLAADGAGAAAVIETSDPRKLAEAIEEMSWDIHRWLIFPADGPRTAHGRGLLAAAKNCTILSTADHDGVIACYRTLKGLSETEWPGLSLAIMHTKSAEEADGVYRKLSGVSLQFLNRRLETEGQVVAAPNVAEHAVMSARLENGAAAVVWSALVPWVSDAASPMAIPEEPKQAVPDPVPSSTQVEKSPIVDGEKIMAEAVTPQNEPIPAETPQEVPLKMDLTEVMDLPGPDASVEAILSAVTQQAAHWIQCPIRPPMCPAAKVCVGRDGQLLLLAVAGRGLRELRAIGQAYRWAAENRSLIKMALPQLSIDAATMPTLRLFVDHADLSADILDPMLQSNHVTVQAYRKLRWGPRTGLMLEAA